MKKVNRTKHESNINNVSNKDRHNCDLHKLLGDIEGKVDQIGKEILALENQLDSYQEKVRDVIYD